MLVALLIIAITLGVAHDVLGGRAEGQSATAPAGRFEARAVFCPPRIVEDSGAQLAATAAGHETIPVGIEPAAPEAVHLAGGRALLRSIDPGAPPEITGFGGALVASVLEVAELPIQKRAAVTGVGAGNCAAGSSEWWYFAQGSSLLDSDERLLVSNPFPEEAVVKVHLLTPQGEQVPSGLTQIAVPAGGATVVRINEFAQTQRLVSTVVETIRGRVIAWKGVMTDPEDGPSGFTFTLGATAPAKTWFFPQGEIGTGTSETISVLNPGEGEADVTISLATSDGLVQPPELVDLPIEARTSRSIDLGGSVSARQANLGAASVVLQSTNGAPVVAERTVAYNGEEMIGVSSEIGLTAGASEWMVGPAAAKPGIDTLAVMNAGPGQVRIDVSLRTEGGTINPRQLRGLRLSAGARVGIPLHEFTDGETSVARVVATGPVVVERLAYSPAREDVGTLMGQPLE